MTALEAKVAAQSAQLEEVEAEKLWVTAKVADLKEILARSEGRVAELEATNVNLNIARDEAITGRIAV